MDLHAWIASEVADTAQRLESAMFEPLPHDHWCRRADDGGSTPAYVLWHSLRHHDIAVNAVLRGRATMLERHDLGVAGDRGLGETEDPIVAASVEPAALEAYARDLLADSVEWLEGGTLPDLDTVPDASGALGAAGVGEDDYPWLYRMWQDKPAAFFLRWEAQGHLLNHIGELTSIKNRMGFGRF